jgi:hypothetical protein
MIVNIWVYNQKGEHVYTWPAPLSHYMARVKKESSEGMRCVVYDEQGNCVYTEEPINET